MPSVHVGKPACGSLLHAMRSAPQLVRRDGSLRVGVLGGIRLPVGSGAAPKPVRRLRHVVDLWHGWIGGGRSGCRAREYRDGIRHRWGTRADHFSRSAFENHVELSGRQATGSPKVDRARFRCLRTHPTGRASASGLSGRPAASRRRRPSSILARTGSAWRQATRFFPAARAGGKGARPRPLISSDKALFGKDGFRVLD